MSILYLYAMCYSAMQRLEDELEMAKLRGDSIETINKLHQALEQLKIDHQQKPKRFQYFAYGFGRSEMVVYTDKDPYKPQFFTWGLLQPWHKTKVDIQKGLSGVLNARGESIFEKPSFKNSAKNKRCLIPVESFFENHHQKKLKYPFRVMYKDGKPMMMAGLWNEWTDIETGEIINQFAIVTTSANELMSKVHNNPDAELGPRMPVILPKDKQNEWLAPCISNEDIKHIQSLIRPLEDGLLRAYPVHRHLGKEGVGNSPLAIEPYDYPELEFKG